MGDTEVTSHCYCAASRQEPEMISCQKCKRFFHTGCLKLGSPSTLLGDIFYYLTCANCADDQTEECDRMELQWLQVVMLALYNLQVTSAGKRGYFRWKEHICAFIDRHWFTFFGPSRKKTTTWYGTVAGILSSNRPTYFRSGVADLGESGWWSLAENKPPTMDTFRHQKHHTRAETREVPQVEGLRRRRRKTTMEAAMELKAKRAMMLESKEIRRGKRAQKSKESAQSEAESAASKAHPPTPPARQEPLKLKLPAATSTKTSQPDVTTTITGLVTALTSPSFTQEVSMDTETGSVSMEPSETSGMETEGSLDDSHRASELSGDSSFINSSILSKSSLMECDMGDQDSQMSVASSNWLTERDLVVGDQVPQCLMMEDDGEESSDLDIDICAITPPASPAPPEQSASDGLPRMAELLSSLSADKPAFAAIKQEPVDDPNETAQSDSDDRAETNTESEPQFSRPATPAYHGAVTDASSDAEPLHDSGPGYDAGSTHADSESPECTPGEGRGETSKEVGEEEKKDTVERTEQEVKLERGYVPLSLYEERLLLRRIEALGPVAKTDPRANRLRRKLLVRQAKRERGVGLYDLDADAKRLASGDMTTQTQIPHHPLNREGLPVTTLTRSDKRVLDRFQLRQYPAAYQDQPVSFLNRLVGSDDTQLQPIRSPYTARMLKPFIRRDYESQPRKLRLLEEIRAYPHRNDPTWRAPPPPPVDYCYVRPHHIPAINTICRQFFWPGIDLSECLQYPDFSCVVLYRKFIIGFAFMVPDVKYNEAYISFIFTHPEWRGAGIATFMLYHLIQTCMGKDVTLHVSANNSALLLYQRFGFKPEQFILDFYDKYYPEDSPESRHAFFLRLRR